MSYAKVQDKGAISTGASITKTFAGTVTAGNLRVACFRVNKSRAVVLAGTTPAGWAERDYIDDVSAGQYAAIWDQVAAGGEDQEVEFVWTGSSLSSLRIIEFSGPDASPFDDSTASDNAASTTAQPGALTPAESGELLICMGSSKDSNAGVSIDSDFVLIDTGTRMGVGYKIKIDADAEDPTITFGASVESAALMVAYRAGDPGGGGGGGGGSSSLDPEPYNPTNPLVAGEEWTPKFSAAKQVQSIGVAYLERFDSSVAETIDSLMIYAPVARSFLYHVVEIYEEGNETAGDVNTATYFPNEDVFNDFGVIGQWTDETGDSSVGTLYQSIDEASYNPADYLRASPPAYQSLYRAAFGTAAFPAIGASRVVQVRINVVASVDPGAANQIEFWLNKPVGSGFSSSSGPLTITGQTVTISWALVDNPHTGLPWTETDIAGFDDGTYDFGIRHLSANPSWTVVPSMFMKVDYVTENRVAMGRANGFTDDPGWVNFNLVKMDGSDGWAKADDKRYTVVLRRPQVIQTQEPSVGQLAWAYIGGQACPHAGHAAGAATSDGAGLLTGILETTDEAFSLIMVRDDAAVSADSQPYARMVAAPVNVTALASQEFSINNTDAYGRVRVRARFLTGTTAPLIVKVKVSGSEVGEGATVSIGDAARFIDLGNAWRYLDFRLSVFASLSASDLAVLEFTSTDPIGWEVAYLDTVGEGETATYGGTTDAATVSGARSTSFDLVATLAAVPPSLAGLIVELLNNGIASNICADEMPYSRLVWNPSDLGDLFGFYYVERWESDVGLWYPIARIETEDGNAFHDHEARRGIDTCYRVSVGRIDGTRSEPSDSECLTPTAPDTTVLALVSNEQPELNTGVIHLNNRQFTFLDGARRILRPLMGRDYQMAFGETEYRGDQFEADVFVYQDDPGAPDDGTDQPGLALGRDAFDKLIAIGRAPLSYVAVLDEAGGRWLASLQVLNGLWQCPQYSAHIRVTEVTDRPSTPNVVPAGAKPGPGGGGGGGGGGEPGDFVCPDGDPGGLVAYMGCSNSWMAVAGYAQAVGDDAHGGCGSNGRFWPVIDDYGGGTVHKWTLPNDVWWSEFDTALATCGVPSVVWFNLCAHDLPHTSDSTDEIYADAVEALAVLAEKVPNCCVYVNGIQPYEDGWADNINWQEARDAAQRLVDNNLANAMPAMSTLGPGLTSGSDHTHPNNAGRLLLGHDLLDFFGAADGP